MVLAAGHFHAGNTTVGTRVHTRYKCLGIVVGTAARSRGSGNSNRNGSGSIISRGSSRHRASLRGTRVGKDSSGHCESPCVHHALPFGGSQRHGNFEVGPFRGAGDRCCTCVMRVTASRVASATIYINDYMDISCVMPLSGWKLRGGSDFPDESSARSGYSSESDVSAGGAFPVY